MHVESFVKISRCVENLYVRRVENHIENHVRHICVADILKETFWRYEVEVIPKQIH